MTLPEFQSFPSIKRLIRDCIVTEKLDGTNAQVFVSEDLSVVAAGSRNRWITPEDDNCGFARWVADNSEELKKLGPGHHYGEWWGAGIQRRYGLTEKRFSLFNVRRWGDDAARPACCAVVPVLYQGDFDMDKIDAVILKMEHDGSAAAPGFMQPEGIVVYHTHSGTLFKWTFGGDGHKGDKK